MVWPDEEPNELSTEPKVVDDADEDEADEDDFADFKPAQKVDDESTDEDEDEVQASRYERNSAKLPRIGDDAANVVRSLESFRQSLKGS